MIMIMAPATLIYSSACATVIGTQSSWTRTRVQFLTAGLLLSDPFYLAFNVGSFVSLRSLHSSRQKLVEFFAESRAGMSATMAPSDGAALTRRLQSMITFRQASVVA
jgi:hypothetical protein